MFGIMAIVIIISGVVCVLIGLAFLAWSVRLLLVSERAVGVVVDNEARVSTEPDGTRATFIHPVVEFEDSDGHRHRVTLAAGTAGVRPFAVGRQVEVLYPAHNPEKARIRHFLFLWFVPMWCAGLGVIAVVFGYLFHTWTSGLP